MQHKSSKKNNSSSLKKTLNAYSLAGIGIGGIIGAGFFLGSSLAINQAGPSVILAFLFGGIIMSQVLGAMTSISINHPVQGSFRVYTEQFLGRYTGFLLGWIIFINGIFAVGSEAIASGIFIRYWFPGISNAVFAVIALAVVIAINGLGTKYFSYIETVMSAIKITILILFIILGGLFILRNGLTVLQNPFHSFNTFFPNNIAGFFQSMLIVVFTYSGISAVAMATSEVKDPRHEIPKATVILTLSTVALYVLSMLVIVSNISWSTINTNISPFVQVFDKIGAGWASALTNGVILVAAFSVMAGTYFGCIQMLVSLSGAQEAPKMFMVSTQKGLYKNSWIVTAVVSLIVVLVSFILGSKLFNYLISSSSYFSFLNWILNLVTYIIWLKKRDKSELYDSPLISGRYAALTTIAVIIILLVLSLRVPAFRIGFYVALGIVFLISVSYKLTRRVS